MGIDFDSYIDSVAYDETNYCYNATTRSIEDVVHQLIEKGSSCPTYSWSVLVKPLTINGERIEHIHGKRVGQMYEDDFVNGIDIQRNKKTGKVFVRVFTHWMGEVVCECELIIVKGSFVSCSINRLAWGVHGCTETEAVIYFEKMLQSMDIFKWH